jgi:hypothetical protein
MKTFNLVRKQDLSGVSGTGIVATGCLAPTGKVAVFWLTEIRSVVIYDRIEDVLAIHGHEGATELIWQNVKNGIDV